MASAVLEIGEAAAPELESVGAKVAPKLEEVGSEAASKIGKLFGKKATALEESSGRETMDRLMDVSTGVMIGQSLQGSDAGSKAAAVPQLAAQTIAAVQAPPGAALSTPTTGSAEHSYDTSGRFVPRRHLHHRGFDTSDDAPFAGGAAPTGVTTIITRPRPLAESLQIAILIVLAIIIIGVTIAISIKRPDSLVSFGYGVLLGAVSGSTVFFILGSRSGHSKA